MKKKSANKAMPTLMPDKDWEACEDARTLARAEEIMKDPARLSKAAKEAGKMVDEHAEKLKSLKKIARKAPQGKKS